MASSYKTDFKTAFPEKYSHLSNLVKEARKQTVDLIDKNNPTNGAPQPVLRPSQDIGVNNGGFNSYQNDIAKIREDLDKIVDEDTRDASLEMKQDIKGKIDYLMNPENKELDEKDLDESSKFMSGKINEHKQEKSEKNMEEKSERINKASDRFSAMLISYKEENEKSEPLKDKMENKEDKLPKSSENYNQTLNYKIEPMEGTDGRNDDRGKENEKNEPEPEPDPEPELT